jgi:hypothetical protein
MYIYIILVLILSPTLLFAYLDPGTGTVIINLLIAAVMAGIYSFKSLILRMLGKGKSENSLSCNQYRISILTEGHQYWSTFQPIVNALISKNIPFRYYTLDVHDPALTIRSDIMQARFLGYGTLAHVKASQIEADILLSTTPNIGTAGYPIKRSPLVKEMIHIFHSINDISMYQTGSLDHYDTVYMVGDFQEKSIREIESLRQLEPKKLIALGLPYIDVLLNEVSTKLEENAKKIVLVGSSWGSKGCLQSYGTDFIRDIALAGYQVIVRPHPQSLRTEQHLLSQYKEELKDIPNINWDETISPAESMSQADILISDTSAIRYDFAFLYENPVITLFISSEEMPNYERAYLTEIWDDTASAKIGSVLNRAQLPQLLPTIEQALQKFDSSSLLTFRDQTIVNFGHAGEAIANYLQDQLKEEADVL